MKLQTINHLSITLTLFAAVNFPAVVHSQTDAQSFNIDGYTYYLHHIAFHDLSAFDPKDAIWNQNIVADQKYVYLADHTDNSSTHLTIKRYNALDGTRAEDIVISREDLEYNYIDELTDDERCFYLVNCNDDNHFILFLNTPPEGIPRASFETYFYLIDKNGHITREFCAKSIPSDNTFAKYGVADFGIPDFIGNPAEGNFQMLLPMVDATGNFMIVKYTYNNYKQASYRASYYNYDTAMRFTKPSVQIVDDSYMIVDDIDIHPSLYSHDTNINQCYGELSDNHIAAHGFRYFDFDNHRLIASGDIRYPDNDTNDGVTYFNIGLWDPDIDNRADISGANPGISFDGYIPLASLGFGKSSIATNTAGLFSYAYRQFIAVSDYGNSTKHLHFYVPGEFLATYQLNKNDRPTEVERIIEIGENSTPEIHITDKNIVFNQPISNVSVFNVSGNKVYQAVGLAKTIDMSGFAKGAYIIATPQKSFKIIL